LEPALGVLKVVTTYEAPRKLRRAERASLVEQTLGQWSDGLEENAFAEPVALPGGRVAFLADAENVEVVQRAGGTARRPSTLHKAAQRGDVAKIEKLLDAVLGRRPLRQESSSVLRGDERRWTSPRRAHGTIRASTGRVAAGKLGR